MQRLGFQCFGDSQISNSISSPSTGMPPKSSKLPEITNSWPLPTDSGVLSKRLVDENTSISSGPSTPQKPCSYDAA